MAVAKVSIREDFPEMVANKRAIPPLFVMNAIDDQVTPVDRCLDSHSPNSV
jgi:hypothetical protein